MGDDEYLRASELIMSNPTNRPASTIDWKHWQKIAVNVIGFLSLVATVLAVKPEPKPDPAKPVSPVVVVEPVQPQADPESWIIKDASGRRIVDASLEKIAGSLKAGRWVAEGIPKPGEMGLSLTISVDDGVVVVPPTPPTPPTPPEPPPSPSPVADAGLRVLIVHETDAFGDLPAGQREIIGSNAPGSVREYLDTHCIKVNGEPERRILDKDQPDGLARESTIWQAVWKRPRASIPWIVVSNGKEGFEGPLPLTPADCLALIKKYEVK
jgi:hypothetical protein